MEQIDTLNEMLEKQGLSARIEVQRQFDNENGESCEELVVYIDGNKVKKTITVEVMQFELVDYVNDLLSFIQTEYRLDKK